MGAADLSAALWQERRHLELLLFRLETQRLHVLAGNLQWLGLTASEVESVLESLRFEALARSVESAAVAVEWGLPAQATLLELSEGAPAGSWPEVLHEHLAGLRGLLSQLADAARASEELLTNLNPPESFGTPPAVPAGTGNNAGTGADTAGTLERLTLAANIERALTITRRTTQPLLRQYLGDEN